MGQNLNLFQTVIEEVEGDVELSNDLVGRAAEFLTCSVLSELGVFVHHVPCAGYDLIAECAGTMLRIQVKARSAPTPGTKNGGYGFKASRENRSSRIRGQRASRPLDRRDCDIIALVALDKRRAIFLPVEKACTGSISISASEFDSKTIERTSWLQVTNL